MAKESKKTCMVLGIGCVVVLLVIGLGAAGFVYYGVKKAKDTFSNPQEAVRAHMGADQLPPGYYPGVAVSVPFIMDFILLTDVEPTDGKPTERINERGFFYISILSFSDTQEVEGYFRGDSDSTSALRKNGINIDTNEILSRGVLEINGAEFFYVTQRGSININTNSAANQGRDGLSSLILFKCGDEKRIRIGIMMGPEPKSEVPITSSEDASATAPSAPEVPDGYAGTVADPLVMKDFLSYFNFCSP